MPFPPGPPLPTAVQTLLWIKRPTELMHYCASHYGKSFTLRLPQFRVMVTSEREAIRTIFAAKPDDMHAGRFNRILRSLVGSSSVLLLDGAAHMQRRKLLLPSFHGERMRFYGNTMAEITRATIASWPSGEPFALHPYTQEITLQIILRTVFGAEEGAQLSSLRTQIRKLLARGERPSAFVPMLYLSTRPELEKKLPWRWLLARREQTDQLLYRQIASRRADPHHGRHKDVLSMLLDARDEEGQGLSDRDLRDELMTALAAGHETTATSLAWAVERLLSTPDVYHKLRDEVRALGPDPDPEKLTALPYLDATIKEVLRLRPVVPIVGRVITKPYTLAGHDLAPGTPVAACIYLAHRDPDVYPDPETFRPERFVGVTPDPVSWLPFGGGIRRCVGAQFALYEMKIVLGNMLASCELELAQRTPARIIRRAVTFWPEGGTVVRARRIAA
jgi:cytochrome P450